MGLDNVHKSIGDLLFQARSVEKLEELLRKLFLNCRKESVQISQKKFKSASQVVFGGTLIDTCNGEVLFKHEEDKVERIKAFPSPNSRV